MIRFFRKKVNSERETHKKIIVEKQGKDLQKAMGESHSYKKSIPVLLFALYRALCRNAGLYCGSSPLPLGWFFGFLPFYFARMPAGSLLVVGLLKFIRVEGA